MTRKSRASLLTFTKAGHQVGNHTWSHADYGTLSADGFRKEVQKTDKILRPWMGEDRLFRFPYLREGETQKTKAQAKDILLELGYRNVRVSIDNDEWRFNKDYMDALDRVDLQGAQRIADDYIQHMQDQTKHFQALTKKAIGRDVAHILLTI